MAASVSTPQVSASSAAAKPIVVGGRVTGYSDGAGAAGLTPGQSAAPAASGGSSGGSSSQPNNDQPIINGNDQVTGYAPAGSPLLVTSSQSRTAYNSNATNLQKAISNVAPSTSNPSIVDYLNKAGLPSDYASRAALATSKGITGYAGTASQNLQLLSMLQGSTGGGTDDTKTPATDPNANPNPQVPVAGAAPADGTAATGAAAGSTTSPDGTSTDPNDPTAGLPPAIAQGFKDTLTAQDQNIAQAQATLEQAKATMLNDPAAQAAASLIQSQYDVLIQAQKAKNAVAIGSIQENAARNGSLQFANDMETSFMSDEMQKQSDGLADLVTKENEALLKSSQAFSSADVKAFNTAQTALEKATNDKQTTLGKLLTATNNQVKAVQAQQKADAQTKKDGLSSDVTLSKNVATAMVAQLKANGITDPDQIAAYVKAMATKEGISNSDILANAVATAQTADTKATLAEANTQSTINKRGQSGSGTASTKGGTDGGYSYTAADVAQYTALMNKGGTDPEGNVFAGRGADGFVDPGSYNAALEDWVSNGGTPTGFAKKFPVKGNVNPASYGELPAAIQPAAKTASTTQYTT